MDIKHNAYSKNMHNLDITNPRNWYSLLSEKLRSKNGAIEFSHPNDNTFLPQLAEEHGVGERTCDLQRPRVVKHRCLHEPPTKVCKEATLSTLSSFYKKEFPEALKRRNHVKFLDKNSSYDDHFVFLPKLPSIQNNIGASKQIIISNENVYHSHVKNIEDWFSPMPNPITTKDKRKIMEQSICEYVSKLAPLITSLPKVDQLHPNEMTNYVEIQNDSKNVLNRKIYRMQLKSILQLNYGGISILDKMDVKRREFPTLPTFHKAHKVKGSGEINKPIHNENNADCDSDLGSDLGFDPISCPLFIVNTKRNMQVEPENDVIKSNGAMPRQKKLKGLRKDIYQQTKVISCDKTTTEKGVIVLSLDRSNQQLIHRPAKQQPNSSEENNIDFKNDCLVGQVDTLTSEQNKMKALQVNYNKLEVFSENKSNNATTREVKLIDVTNKREIPKYHPPVYKLDQKQTVIQRKGCQKPHEMDNIVPLKIVKDVVILGSPEKRRTNDVNIVNSD